MHREHLARAIGVRIGPKASSDRTPVEGINKYNFTLSDEEIAAGVHRKKVGRAWRYTARLQHDFLVAQGMTPTSNVLDVGCGALRAGILIAKYLEPGRYYGIDINESLIRAGLLHELPLAGLEGRVPAGNLRATDRFECDFGVAFDFAIAQSVFTHLPLNHIRLCLYQLSLVMAPGGRFFATFFEAPAKTPYDRTVQQAVRKTWPERDPYHYRRADLAWAAETVADWNVRYIGDWGHRRGQRMIEYTLNSPATSGALRRSARTLASGARRRARSTAGDLRRRWRARSGPRV
jgi:SAM-dependent methyltransferase